MHQRFMRRLPPCHHARTPLVTSGEHRWLLSHIPVAGTKREQATRGWAPVTSACGFPFEGTIRQRHREGDVCHRWQDRVRQSAAPPSRALSVVMPWMLGRKQLRKTAIKICIPSIIWVNEREILTKPDPPHYPTLPPLGRGFEVEEGSMKMVEKLISLVRCLMIKMKNANSNMID